MLNFFKIKQDGDGDIVTKAEAKGLYPDATAPDGVHVGVAGRNATVSGNNFLKQGTPIVTFYSNQPEANWEKYEAVRQAFLHLTEGGGGWPVTLMAACDTALQWLQTNEGFVEIFARPLLCNQTLIHFNEKPVLADADCDCDNCSETEAPPSSNHDQHSHRLLVSNGGTVSEDLIFYHPVTWDYYAHPTTRVVPHLIVSIADGAPAWQRVVYDGVCALIPNDKVFISANSPSRETSSYSIYTPEEVYIGSIPAVPDFHTGNIAPSWRLFLIPKNAVSSATLGNYNFGYAINSGYTIPFYYSWDDTTAEILENFFSRAGWTKSAEYSSVETAISKHPSAPPDYAGLLLDWMYGLEEWSGDNRTHTPLANAYENKVSSVGAPALWAGRYAANGLILGANIDSYFTYGNPGSATVSPGEGLIYSSGNKVSQRFSAICNSSEDFFQPLFHPNNGNSWANACSDINNNGDHPWLAYHSGETPPESVDKFNIVFDDLSINVSASGYQLKIHLHISGDWASLSEVEKQSYTDTVVFFTEYPADRLFLMDKDGFPVEFVRGSDDHGLRSYSAIVPIYQMLGDETDADFVIYDESGNALMPTRLFTNGFFMAETVVNLDAEATRYPLLPH